MTPRVCFATLDLLWDSPSVCDVCTNSPTFRYEFHEGGENTWTEYLKGFCCASCAVKLLQFLRYAGSQECVQEQTDLGGLGVM